MDTMTPNETLADDGLNQTIVNATTTQDLSNLSVLVEARDKHRREFSLGHLNINNLQNKFEEIAEFYIPGYSIYRNDRKKGGGGVAILAYVSSDVMSLARN